MINEENNIVKDDKQYNNFSEENISKEADETVEQNIKALEDSLKNKTNEENNFSKNQNTENTGDAFEQIDNKKAELLNKIKTDSEKSIQGKGDVVLHDDELKPLNKKKRVLKNNSEHTYITGIGVIDDNNIFLSKAHLKKICSFLGLSIVLFFLLSYIVPVIIKFILDFSSFNGTGVYSSIITNQTGYQIITIILYLISLCVPYLIYRAFIKIPFSVAISRRKTPKGSFLKLIFTAMMFAAVANVLGGIFSTILSQIFGDGIMASSLNVPTDITAFILFFISTAVLPAIIEEGIFRGIVLQSLRPHGDGLAIILSSAIFAICHGSIHQIISAFIFGLAMGFIVVRTGSLKITIIAHFVNNFLSCLITFLNGELQENIVNLIFIIVYLIIFILGTISIISLSSRSKKMFDFSKQSNYLTGKEKAIIICKNPPLIIGVLTAVVYFIFNLIKY